MAVLTKNAFLNILSSCEAYLEHRKQWIDKETINAFKQIAEVELLKDQEKVLIDQIESLKNKRCARGKGDSAAMEQLREFIKINGWDKELGSKDYFPSPGRLRDIVCTSRAKVNEYKELRVKALGLSDVYEFNRTRDLKIQSLQEELMHLQFTIDCKLIPANWREKIEKEADEEKFLYPEVVEECAAALLDAGYMPDVVTSVESHGDIYTGVCDESFVWFDENHNKLLSYQIYAEEYKNIPKIDIIDIPVTYEELNQIIEDSDDSSELDEILGTVIDTDDDSIIEPYVFNKRILMHSLRINIRTIDGVIRWIKKDVSHCDDYGDYWVISEDMPE